MKIEVIAQPGAAPDAYIWTPSNKARDKHLIALTPVGWRFDAKLSNRWDCIVSCSREFSAWWRARPGRPTGFFLTTFA